MNSKKARKNISNKNAIVRDGIIEDLIEKGYERIPAYSDEKKARILKKCDDSNFSKPAKQRMVLRLDKIILFRSLDIIDRDDILEKRYVFSVRGFSKGFLHYQWNTMYNKMDITYTISESYFYKDIANTGKSRY